MEPENISIFSEQSEIEQNNTKSLEVSNTIDFLLSIFSDAPDSTNNQNKVTLLEEFRSFNNLTGIFKQRVLYNFFQSDLKYNDLQSDRNIFGNPRLNIRNLIENTTRVFSSYKSIRVTRYV